MDQSLRGLVRSRIADISAEGSFVDVPVLASALASEFGYEGRAQTLMLFRLIMRECAIAGIAMQLGEEPGSHSQGECPGPQAKAS
ncbi:hypothetical protein [Aurantimonas sp. VKM B-3413]|uniref:hypothetical protein n=1 Tax=Aurantimonas sp. VKM B-3413 TaxID=2779401 RepID=UPI001E4B310D|nr:hypothetical protein [Aurantimonas sp. VKM B-3413]MCB8839260.1 hypothetical protein [Aurantimonas sp. VKM B-3413]